MPPHADSGAKARRVADVASEWYSGVEGVVAVAYVAVDVKDVEAMRLPME